MNDPLSLLRRDHREVKALLRDLAESKPGAKRERLLDEVERDLLVHMEIEEQVIYPAVERVEGAEKREEADVEHDLARDGLQKLRELVDGPGFAAVVEMVMAGVTHHVREEENEVLPRLKKKLSDDEWQSLGDQVAELRSASLERSMP